jgi:hypothetical protein
MPSDDRWATEFQLSNTPVKQPAINKTVIQKKNNVGIDPTGFHKKKRSHNELSQTEKALSCLLQQASKNEVVQKRKNYTTVKKAQLEEFESVTDFRIFPLQVSYKVSLCCFPFLLHYDNIYSCLRILQWTFLMK